MSERGSSYSEEEKRRFDKEIEAIERKASQKLGTDTDSKKDKGALDLLE